MVANCEVYGGLSMFTAWAAESMGEGRPKAFPEPVLPV